jgi:hypothetical protein
MNEKKYYTGVGSRKTPEEICFTMTEVASKLEGIGYVLRSGHAEKADDAFEKGVRQAEMKRIFLPWRGFNGSDSHFCTVSDRALSIARKFHPVFDKLSPGAKLLMGRNSYQVLGWDLQTPSEFLLSWTANGKPIGGTGQAIRIANYYNIPTYNFYFPGDIEKIFNFIKCQVEA